MSFASLNLLVLCTVFLVDIPFSKVHCTEQVNVEKHCNGGSIVFNITIPNPCGDSVWKPIPEGYQFFPGFGYYKFYGTPKKWNEASTVCHNEGGHLAVPNSEEEAKTIVRTMTSKIEYAYVGLYYKEVTRKWVTLFDQPSGFLKWHKGEPNNMHLPNNCGMIFPDGLLGDHPCLDPKPFFCKLNRNSA